jgi:hypothetical protein
LRQKLLDANDKHSLIDSIINIHDNAAIEILRIIETQKKLMTKWDVIWLNLITEGSKKIENIMPEITEIHSRMDFFESSLTELQNTFINSIDEQETYNSSRAMQQKLKLSELLNKY